MIVWGRSRRELKGRYSEIRAFLWDELRLRPKGKIQLNQCLYGIPFLGFRVFPHGFRLGRARWRRIREKCLVARAAFEQGRWDETDLSRHGDAVIGSLKPADSPGVRRRIFQFGKGA